MSIYEARMFNGPNKVGWFILFGWAALLAAVVVGIGIAGLLVPPSAKL